MPDPTPADDGLLHHYVFQNGKRYPVTLRPVSPEEVVRRRQAAADEGIDPETAPIYDPKADEDDAPEPVPAPKKPKAAPEGT